MELLKEVAHISGKGGLFRIIKPTRSGVIVESLDEAKGRSVVGANSRVSILKEISVYTDSKEGATALADVLSAIHEKYGKPLEINPKTASETAVAGFFAEIVPDYDRDRVYLSDMKKIITWYNTLISHLPEIFEKKAEEAEPLRGPETGESESAAGRETGDQEIEEK
ncbi:MAG: DUF5606 domain-containing protein [Ferruginibacter sp.]|nr:DUF5606 domain-containing protein [Cytophagales bacterium]